MPAPLSNGVDSKIEMLRRMPEREARPQAAKQLEVEFLAQLLSALRKTVPRNDFLPKAPSREVYDGLFDHAVAERMAAGDPLGLAHLLAQAPQSGEGLKLRQGTAEKESAAPGLAGRK